MSGAVALLSAAVVLLGLMVLYQHFAFRTGVQAKLDQISGQLARILDGGSDERVMVFTDNRALIQLADQLNRLLDDRQRRRAEYRRSEISARKMLSNISHDMKTPMTVILGYLEIIQLNGDPQNHMLKKVEAKAQHMMALINQFFTLAKLEAGDMDLPLCALDLSEVCRETILDFYELLTQKNIQLHIDLPDKAVPVQANRDALQRILCNLISNAIRYGADGGYLGVALRVEGDTACIDVTDHGKGIERACAATVFDRLFTMEDSRSRDIQGNGLGLTIARALARQLGGDVTLRSEPSVETVFTVTLRRLG